MASALSKQRDYSDMAEKYSQLNEVQVNYGKKLAVLLNLKQEDKVLDMGCGTGEVTSFITDLVGEHGQVLGIDPDKERIKVAIQKHSGTKKNLKFMAGDSSTPFPHYNEEYYDVHYSNFVFLWLTVQEKDVFLKTAISCLKPGGRIAMHCNEKNPEIFTQVPELLPDEEIEGNRSPFQIVQKSVAESMLLASGFEIVSSEFDKYDYLFSNLDHYLTWFCASGYIDESRILPHKKEAFAKRFANDDGTVYLDMKIYRIIAKKSR